MYLCTGSGGVPLCVPGASALVSGYDAVLSVDDACRLLAEKDWIYGKNAVPLV